MIPIAGDSSVNSLPVSPRSERRDGIAPRNQVCMHGSYSMPTIPAGGPPERERNPVQGFEGMVGGSESERNKTKNQVVVSDTFLMIPLNEQEKE